ncbi:MAG: glycosyltransferase family 4 protein [Nitrosopumilaceae archaeon]
MKLLIAGAKTKFFHLSEFGNALTKFGVNYKLVHDVDIYTGFPSKDIREWFQTPTKFNRLIEEFKPDAVFVDRQTHFGLAALKTNIPLFVHLRGDYWSELKWAKETLYKTPHRRFALWCREKIADRCFSGATTILPICNYLGKIVRAHYPNKQIETLYQGISPLHWYPTSAMDLKHPCVGLLQDANIWGKTKEMLILTKVMEALPDVTFYWAGAGPYMDHVLPTLRKYDNFKWLGRMEYPDKVREYLMGIDVYTLVSGIDMSPLTLQEAALMEKPVIATNVGGIPELIGNKTEFLVKKGDYRCWVEKITTLINDTNKAKALGTAARKYVTENFAWDIIAKKFVTILNALVSSNGSVK